jgi:hypothetical protein
VATFFVLKDHFAEQRVKTNPWMGQMRNLLEDQAKSRDLLNVENPWYAEEGTFYKLLSLMYEANRDKYDPEETLATACNGTVNPALAKLIVESMIGNFTLAKQMGVFEETTNILQLENGSAPVAAAIGWEDEKLLVGHRVSPVLAPEAASSLVNLVLMPETYRDLQEAAAHGFDIDKVKKWRLANVITPESADAIVGTFPPR